MKWKTTLLTAVITASLLTGTVYAARNFGVSDAVRLQRSLHESQGGSADYDLDESGEVDVFDLALMEQSLSADTGKLEAFTCPATDEYVKLQSRTVTKDGVTWLVQSGSAMESYITANSVKLTLAGSSGIQNGADYRPRYGIWVDGEQVADTIMEDAEQTVTLWEGTESRTAKVTVMLLSEAMYGGVGVKSIDVESSAAFPVKPVPQSDLCVEFIGDSITCAYGVEGASQSEHFKTPTENFSKSYAYLAAQQLGADYFTCCYSGYGIVSGYTSDGTKNAESLIPDCYEKSSKFADYGTEWDFESRPVDAVVINLGTNDSTYISDDPENRGAEFVEDYKAFLAMVREKHPDVPIICTVGTMGCEDVYTLLEQVVSEYREATGEENVTCYFSQTHSMADGMGSDWHPSEKTQRNSACVIADKICQALGRHSDQMGLDVAADAQYDMVTAESANAAHFVGYDKSFWINTVTGGSAPADVEAVLSGVTLQAGGRYLLSCDVTATPEREFPVVIRGAKEYFTESVKAGAEETHFETEFTAPQGDKAAQIVFQVGGADSSNVNLKNIKLTRIG